MKGVNGVTKFTNQLLHEVTTKKSHGHNKQKLISDHVV